MIHRKHSGFVSVLFVIFSNFVVCRVSVCFFVGTTGWQSIHCEKEKNPWNVFTQDGIENLFLFFSLSSWTVRWVGRRRRDCRCRAWCVLCDKAEARPAFRRWRHKRDWSSLRDDGGRSVVVWRADSEKHRPIRPWPRWAERKSPCHRHCSASVVASAPCLWPFLSWWPPLPGCRWTGDAGPRRRKRCWNDWQ